MILKKWSIFFILVAFAIAASAVYELETLKYRAAISALENTKSPVHIPKYDLIQSQPAVAPVPPGASVRVPVLMYHYVREVVSPKHDPAGFNLSVTPKNFEDQISYLSSHSYQTVTPDELFAAVSGKKILPPKTVILTFDDGYEDFYSDVFPVLKKYHFQATLFVVPGFVADPGGQYVTWAELREMDHSGLVTVGAHTLHHVDLILDPRRGEEIAQSKEILEKLLGHPVLTFAYPSGEFDPQVQKLVQESGYDMAFTTQYGTAYSLENRFAAPRVRVSGGERMEDWIKNLGQ